MIKRWAASGLLLVPVGLAVGIGFGNAWCLAVMLLFIFWALYGVSVKLELWCKANEEAAQDSFRDLQDHRHEENGSVNHKSGAWG